MQRPAAAPPRGHIFVLVGPSGGGKTTLIRALTGHGAPLDGPRFTFIPSTTTRAPRPGESEGVDYFFVDEARFEADAAAGGFCEWQRVHDHRYGSSRLRLGNVVAGGDRGLIQADILGAFKIKAAMPADVTTVFITPSRVNILRDRILGRGHVTPSELRRRLQRVAMETQLAYACDHLVLNDALGVAVSRLRVLAQAQDLESLRLLHFGRRPVRRMIALSDPPSAECGTRFCVADCELPREAAVRALHQWWWELHPGATAFALPAYVPTQAGAHVEEAGDAILEVSEWRAQVAPGAWARAAE